jgi:hypothetical protein
MNLLVLVAKVAILIPTALQALQEKPLKQLAIGAAETVLKWLGQ